MDDFTPTQEHTIRFYFVLGILIKGAISAAEIIVGTLALFIPASVVSTLLSRLARSLPMTAAGQFLAVHMNQAASQLAVVSGLFIAIYLISRGLIKLLLIIALLKNQLWAYPLSLYALSAFVLYQGYQIFTEHSFVIVALTMFDLVVMWLIWEEYKVLRSHTTIAHE